MRAKLNTTGFAVCIAVAAAAQTNARESRAAALETQVGTGAGEIDGYGLILRGNALLCGGCGPNASLTTGNAFGS
ncbi:MAG: hypothetical protein EX266_02645 [Rhodobacteraceae bacterium]|nr:MAG: hypothetical protein EX266_02645 [Paracoccaceae bacterium]